jgi:hypothetical protein
MTAEVSNQMSPCQMPSKLQDHVCVLCIHHVSELDRGAL